MPYQTPEFTVRQWYLLYLHREPDPLSSLWVEQLREGQPPLEVLSSILSSDEYYALSGGTPPLFVNHVIADLAGTNVDAAFWASYLALVERAREGQAGRKQVAFDIAYRVEKKL